MRNKVVRPNSMCGANFPYAIWPNSFDMLWTHNDIFSCQKYIFKSVSFLIFINSMISHCIVILKSSRREHWVSWSVRRVSPKPKQTETDRKGRKKELENYVSHVTCEVSCVTFHMSCVTCHVSCILCHLSPVTNANSHRPSPC